MYISIHICTVHSHVRTYMHAYIHASKLYNMYVIRIVDVYTGVLLALFFNVSVSGSLYEYIHAVLFVCVRMYLYLYCTICTCVYVPLC